jgi:acyl-coenzyme A thioesterase PaaI-like protein
MSQVQATAASAERKSRGGLGQMLRHAWQTLSVLPFGNRVFSLMVALKAPYTGTIGARVIELAPRFARVEMRDRWFVRNFVPSVHAIAMTNLGEMTSGLALLCGLPAGMRGIVKKLTTEYFKIAHGTLVAVSKAPEVVVSDEKRVYAVEAHVYELCAADTADAVLLPSLVDVPDERTYGILVATFTAEWHISPATR